MLPFSVGVAGRRYNTISITTLRCDNLAEIVRFYTGRFNTIPVCDKRAGGQTAESLSLPVFCNLSTRPFCVVMLCLREIKKRNALPPIFD